MPQLYVAFDDNNDGFVNVREFCLGMSALVPSASPANKLDFIFKMYDADGNGALDRDECKKLVRDMLESLGNAKGTIDNSRVTQIVDELFQHVDIDNSNSIDVQVCYYITLEPCSDYMFCPVQEFRQLATNPALASIRSEILKILQFDKGS